MHNGEFVVHPGRPVKLAELDPGFTADFKSKADADERLQNDIARLVELQDVFAAARSHALLIIFQGMDSAGKDGVIKHVMSGVNPQGVDVHSFKAPTQEELNHDFLWRCEKVLPERGRIGIFNRSYYEEVVVVRVHRELLALEAAESAGDLWSERFEDINTFERHLVRSGTLVLKFFLHLSKDEQRKRLLKRLEDKDKNWKFSPDDVTERHYWDRYAAAYEQMLDGTTTEWAPWYAIPADRKWFARGAVAGLIVEKLDALGLHYPRLEGKAAELLAQVRSELEAAQA
ncbi:MAG TPA: PPK2 family polyphosphate kinase [Candidatus Baltobacteraceae bacterium]|nr:PPK2 family polyphosphate kinase [Candidatus Baltobacteraceae bacterium]